MYLFIWYLSNTSTFREIANLFGVSKSSAWRVVTRVSGWLIGIGHEYIKWPSSSDVQTISAKFERNHKIPDVIGAIDCTHIRIKAPKENRTAFFNRKRYYSINLQVVVDANKRFISVSCGEPGSLHDSRVLRRSELYRKADADIFPNGTFLIGDSAYPSLEWLVPPFRDNGSLSDAQNVFNYKHSATRIVVEHAIGLLKTRFRRLLHFTEQVNINHVKNLVSCACILHNICMTQNDDVLGDENEQDVLPQEQEPDVLPEEQEPEVQPEEQEPDVLEEDREQLNTNRRQRLFNLLLQKQVL